MKYLLLSNKSQGVLLDRTPVEVKDNLAVEFEGLPTGKFTAAFVLGESRVYYREIKDGVAVLERRLLEQHSGELYIAVKNDDLSMEWICDGLICIGYTLIPDERKDGEVLAQLRKEADNVLTELAELRGIVEKFSDRITEIYDGYDVI